MEIAKKWSGNGFGPSQMTCPKSGQKMVWEFFGPSQLTCPKSGQKVPKKWSKNGLSKIWGQKTAQKVVKTGQKIVFWQIEVAAFGRHPKGGARASRAPPFGSLFAKNNFLTSFLAWADLGWPGSNPRLAQVKPWAGPGSTPGPGPDQALEKLAEKIGPRNIPGYPFRLAFVSVLFDQNLDQKLTWLAWLAWVKSWAGPRSSPGLGPGQALGKLTLGKLAMFS